MFATSNAIGSAASLRSTLGVTFSKATSLQEAKLAIEKMFVTYRALIDADTNSTKGLQDFYREYGDNFYANYEIQMYDMDAKRLLSYNMEAALSYFSEAMLTASIKEVSTLHIELNELKRYGLRKVDNLMTQAPHDDPVLIEIKSLFAELTGGKTTKIEIPPRVEVGENLEERMPHVGPGR